MGHHGTERVMPVLQNSSPFLKPKQMEGGAVGRGENAFCSHLTNLFILYLSMQSFSFFFDGEILTRPGPSLPFCL